MPNRPNSSTDPLFTPLIFQPVCCREVARRLERHGMPHDRIQSVTGELAEHWEDLRLEAQARGCSAAESEAEADQRLGEPSRLAAEVIAGLRERSWSGRHPILWLCLGPLLLPPLLMGLVLGPLTWVSSWIPLPPWIRSGQEWNPYVVTTFLWVVYYAAIIAAFAWLSWRAWVRGLGIRWLVALAAWCALMSLVRHFDADPIKRSVNMGLGYPLRLNIHTTVLLLIHALPAGFLFLRHRVNKANELNQGPSSL